MIAERFVGPDTRVSLWRVRVTMLGDSLRTNWRLFARTKIGLVGLSIIGFYMLMALVYPVLTRTVWEPRVYDPVIGFAYEETRQPAPPSVRHLLGTDPLGRDVLSQLMFSVRSEFMLGVVAALVTVVIATTVGAAAAYYGGFVDAVLMRITDTMIMMPFISVLIVVSSLFTVGLLELGLIIGVLSGFGATAVIIKSQALTIKVKPYIEAARIAGGSDFHIIFTHIVPSLLPLSFLYMMFTVTGAIFSEAALSFFGLMNVQMSWGLMMSTTATSGYLLRLDEFWWLVLPASLSITLLSSSFYLVGRALDEIVNPRLRSR